MDEQLKNAIQKLNKIITIGGVTEYITIHDTDQKYTGNDTGTLHYDELPKMFNAVDAYLYAEEERLINFIAENWNKHKE